MLQPHKLLEVCKAPSVEQKYKMPGRLKSNHSRIKRENLEYFYFLSVGRRGESYELGKFLSLSTTFTFLL